MKINLTKKQYEILIKAVEAGSSVYGILGDMVSDDYKKGKGREARPFLMTSSI